MATITGTDTGEPLNGTDEDDTIIGKGGADQMDGGLGNDTFRIEAATDVVAGESYLGGSGTDTVELMAGAVDFTVAAFSSIERFIGHDFKALAFTTAQIDDIALLFQAPTATINVASSGQIDFSGTNVWIGTLNLNDLGNSVSFVGATGNGYATVNGGAGNDTILGHVWHGTLNGGGGNDSLVGGAGREHLNGGPGDDTIAGGADTDTISGGTGMDILSGGEGSDTFLLADGEFAPGETYDGGAGTDSIIYSGGAADLSGAWTSIENFTKSTLGAVTLTAAQLDGLAGTIQVPSADILIGTAGPLNFSGSTLQLKALALNPAGNTVSMAGASGSIVAVKGGDGADSVTGSAGGDNIAGNGGNDTISGGAGNDTIAGGLGADRLSGGDDNDTFLLGAGEAAAGEIVNGGAGADTIVYGGGSADLSGTWTQVENFTKSGAATLTFTAAQLNGLSGAINAGSVDAVIGTAGSVNFAGSSLSLHKLTLSPAGNKVSMAGATGSIGTVAGDAGKDTITGNDSANLIQGNGANDSLSGGLGNDTLSGGDGADTLRGGGGDDSMNGGPGNDVYFVDSPGDAVTETTADPATGGIDTVFSQIAYTLGANVENLRLQGTGDIGGTGNAIANRIFGTAGANLLQGLAGNDTLEGKDGADTLAGGEGNDTLTGGSQADVFRFAASNAGIDTITDFNKNGDRFDLSGGSFSALSIAPNGDAVLTHAGGTVRVQGPPTLTLAQWNALVLPAGGGLALPLPFDAGGGAALSGTLSGAGHHPAGTLHGPEGDWLFA